MLVALIIDGLQAGLAVGIAALAFVAGPVGGAAAGAAACSIAGSAAAAACAAAGGIIGSFFAGTAAAVAIPIGIGLSYVVSVSIAMGGGAFLASLLILNNMFYPSRFVGGVFGEVFPGINNLPIWTGIVLSSILKKRQEEKIGTTSVQHIKKSVVANDNVPELMVQPNGPRPAHNNLPAQNTAPRVSRSFNDIRPVRSIAAAFALMVLLTGAGAQAQTMPPPIQYVVHPEVPGPGENVRIEVQGVGSFLGSAEIVWRKDGVKVAEGIGERSYSFTTGTLGQKTLIQVSIDSSQGVFANTFTFNPSLINLVWEADTSVPPRHKGKALYSAGSSYKVVALPSVMVNDARISASALSYQWTRADEAVPEQSGLGRSVLALTGDQLQGSEDIAVDVYYGTALVGKGAVSILTSAPKIVLYERDPLRGVQYDTALPAGISLTAKEITVQAEPYYFSNRTKNSGLIPYAWTLGGDEVVGPDSARGILTLRQTGAGTGGALIGVSMQNNNPDQFVQNASTMLQLVFGAETGNSLLNFFGL